MKIRIYLTSPDRPLMRAIFRYYCSCINFDITILIAVGAFDAALLPGTLIFSDY